MYAHGVIQWLAADAVNTTYTATCTDSATGATFQPKGIRFYWMGQGSAVDAVTEAIHSRRGVGFATSTSDRRSVSTQDQDAAATSVCTSAYRTDCVAMTITSTPAVDGLLDLDALLSTGFRCIVDDQGVVDVTVGWEAWGGDGVTGASTGEIVEPAATGNVDYVVTGQFRPAVVLFAGVAATAAANTVARNDSCLCIGAASSGRTINNIVVVGSSDDASTAMDTDGYCQTGECLAQIVTAGGNPDARATLTLFSDVGFRLNWIARAVSNRKNIYLAMAGGEWEVGAYTIAGNSGAATASVTGMPFKPIGISFMGRMTAQSTVATSTANDRIGIGAASSISSRETMGHLSEDATASSACEIDLTIQYDQCLAFPSTAGALLSAYDLDAILEDGFRVIVDTAGGVASEWQGYVACGGIAPTTWNNFQHVRVETGMSCTERTR